MNDRVISLPLLPRAAEAAVRQAMDVFPVVVLMGARQTGKSTLARSIAASDGRPYLTLDDLDVRAEAEQDPLGLLRRSGTLVLDEIQRVPDLLLAIKQVVDSDSPRRPGRFLVTGSANLLLMEKVSDSLAGRAGYVTLHPLTRSELRGDGTAGVWNLFFDLPPDEWESAVVDKSLPPADWLQAVNLGGYPVPAYELADRERANIWFDGYVRTYLERDLQQLAAIDSLVDFRRLMRIASLRIGNLAVQSEIARDAGLTHSTARRYLNLLETSFQLHRIEPFAGNRTKRIVKSPKLYWNDSALALHLAGGDDIRGAHLENLVLTDLMAWAESRGTRAHVHFWRTYDGREVDFVVDVGGQLLAIEVKATERPRPKDWSTLKQFRDEYGDAVRGCLLLHGGAETQRVSDRVLSTPWWSVI